MNRIVPPFDQAVPEDGYAWWYLDAVSDDGQYGITLIAFIGSVFSPYYAWARSRGRGDPMAHCAINVALYGPGGRWSMTERGHPAVELQRDWMRVGPSRLHWDGQALEISLREWAVPIPRRVTGKVRLVPEVIHADPIELHPNGRHHWTPISPAARVEVAFEDPALRWSGSGYFDHNAGSEPLERGFDNWFWARATTRQGPVVLYETQLHDNARHSLTLHFHPDGSLRELPTPRPAELPPSRWGITRPTRSDDGRARLEATWEDTPFYARSLVTSRLLGETVKAVHESLSLKRFSKPWVQLMLPFRMPRRSS